MDAPVRRVAATSVHGGSLAQFTLEGTQWTIPQQLIVRTSAHPQATTASAHSVPPPLATGPQHHVPDDAYMASSAVRRRPAAA